MTKFCLKKLKLFSVSAIGLKKDQIDSCFSFFWPQTSWSQFLLQLSASKNLKLISVSAFGLQKAHLFFCFSFWPQKNSNLFLFQLLASKKLKLIFLFQLLAALLITRQVVGNLKESLLPYATKHLKVIFFPMPVYFHIFLGLTQKHSLDGQNEFWPVWSS